MSIDYIFDNLKLKINDYIVVGVSAGPDSMALLNLLQKKLPKQVVCAHINHNVRKESIEEEEFLKNYCKKNNIIFECLKINSYNENNFENEARKKRYAFYEQLLNKYHSKFLFLAHHGDDLIETVLMKIERGSNLEGYAGIKTYSKLESYTIVRPLLRYTKKDILKYNEENNIKYYTDKTNEDINYTRNRYRLKIIPLLKEEDENIHLKFLSYSETLQEYYNYIEDIINKKINKIYKDNLLNLNLFKKEPLFIQKNIIFYILSYIYNNESNIIKNRHLEAIIKLIYNDKPNSKLSLPKEYYAIKNYNYLSFKKKKIKEDNYKIPLEKYNSINGFIIKQVDNIDTNENNVCRLNSNNIKMPLYIRNRINGDYIEVLELNHKKKIKNIFIDSKIPLDKRKGYPLLVDSNDNILWIPNIKKSKYNVKKDEFCDIILTSYEEREEINEKEN